MPQKIFFISVFIVVVIELALCIVTDAMELIEICKPKKPLYVLVFSRSGQNIHTLFNMMREKYKGHGASFVQYGLNCLEKEIQFGDDEYWLIVPSFSRNICELDYDVFDKIIFDTDVSETFISHVANKVKDRSILRRCDLKTAINKIRKEENG